MQERIACETDNGNFDSRKEEESYETEFIGKNETAVQTAV